MNVSDHLKHLEETLLTSSVRKDRTQVAALLAEEFREIGSSGRTFSRAEIQAELQAEFQAELQAESPLREVALSDFTCTMLSDTLALVIYRTVRSTPPAPPSSAWRSSLWVFREDRWQILFHQGTRVP